MKLYLLFSVLALCALQCRARLPPPPKPSGEAASIPDSELKQARNRAIAADNDRKAREAQAVAHLIQQGKTKRTLHQKFNQLSSRGKNILRKSKLIVGQSNELIENNSARESDLQKRGNEVTENCFTDSQPCSRPARGEREYRTIDGTCNNRKHPYYGSVGIPFTRYLEPNERYRRTGQPRSATVSAKDVSDQFHTEVDAPNSDLTLMTMQFGQFLDHDITFTPDSELESEEIVSVDCCDPVVEDLFDDCFAIKWGDGQCMSLIRSATISQSSEGSCFLGQREQMNDITAYIDASNVYGSDETTQADLYNANTGLMNIYGNDLLPQGTDTCGENACFLAGDVRVNEQVALTMMHTVFMKEHNRLVNILSNKRSSWSGQRKYDEVRHVMAAIMQRIVYSEFLPAVLGTTFVNSFYGLNNDGKATYDENIDPSIANEFATAAYRFGHSMLQSALTMGSSSLLLSTVFFNPAAMYESPDNLPLLIKGLLSDESQTVDEHFTEEVTQRLFGTLDLVALNIQRGRDHGLKPYIKYKDNFTQSVVEDMNKPERDALKAIYGELRHVDLFTGGIAEKPYLGGNVGRLFAEIIGEQFGRLKSGDRFFYKNELRYSSDAVKEIDRVTLSAILCRNGGLAGQSIQKFAFKFGENDLECDSDEVVNWPNVDRLFPRE